MSAIQSIGPEQATLHTVHVDAPTGPSQHQLGAAPVSTGAGSGEYVVKLSNEAVDIAHLQDAKNGINDAAVSFRNRDGSLRQIGDYIDRMKESLLAITKQYPPYPPGSEERVDFLKTFSAFRKLIEKLSFTPSENGNDVTAGREMAASRQT